MEFREYYRGICAKIRFDSHTGAYSGELDGVPLDAPMRSHSYEDLQALLKHAVDDYMAGKKAKLGKEWLSASRLEKTEVSKEAEELEAEMARIASEMFKTPD